MNTLTKALVVLALLAGMTFANSSVSALPPSTTLPAPAPAQVALNALLTQSNSPLPTGTKLLSIGIADGLATVNFPMSCATISPAATLPRRAPSIRF